ncbi:MAG: acyltransferase family protein, partial [Acidimicrobiales bacterium]
MQDTTERGAYWPGLDGLRGLAVAAVLLFHGGISWARGGFLGVSLFFTLSGFLITSIVVRERETTGRVSLTGFWARRARRLLPASILALLLAIVAVRLAVPFTQRVEALGDVKAAAVNLANWRFIWRGAVYADVTRLPSPVQHYWSLAIEEQFYIVYPVVAMFALRRRKVLAAVLGAVVVLSTWRQLSIDDPARVYFGTDTRAAELAIGGLLALGRHRIAALATATWRRLPDALGLVALVATAILWSSLSDTSPGLSEGGFTGIALVSAALVFAAVEGQLLPKLLAVRPLVWLGVVSYGVYLYHFP